MTCLCRPDNGDPSHEGNRGRQNSGPCNPPWLHDRDGSHREVVLPPEAVDRLNCCVRWREMQ